MKTILLLCLCATASFGASAYSVRSTQLGPTGTSAGAVILDLSPPATGHFGFNVIDGSHATKKPVMVSMVPTIFEVGAISGTAPDLQAPLGIKTSFITGIIDTYVGGGSSASDLLSRIAADEADMVTMQSNMSSVDADLLSLQSGKEPTITAGTSAQYWRGDKTWATFPTDLSSFANGPGYITSSALSPYLTTATAASTYATQSALTFGLSGKFDSPSGISAQYLRGDGSLATFPTNNTAFTNGAGYLTGITSGLVTAALGFTPYDSANPSAYITQAGARGAISLTTTGTSGGASYNSATGVLNVPQYAAVPRSFAIPSRSIVTSTSATGFQVSSTRDSQVSYEGTFQTTSTIGGPSSITVFLETSDTNSTTPGDWTIVATQVNSSTITLAVVLQAVDVEPWGLSRIIPAGKYVRIRSGSVTGTATASINAQQQEVILP